MDDSLDLLGGCGVAEDLEMAEEVDETADADGEVDADGKPIGKRRTKGKLSLPKSGQVNELKDRVTNSR